MNLHSPSDSQQQITALKTNLSKVIQGKDEVLDVVIVALLAGGSILMDDVPGVGKTTLAKTLARSVDVTFHRVQFTPDLLPSDILGSSIYNPIEGVFNFREGPIFCNVLLADEINRASPRTQSALLEAMSEMQATIEGVLHPLPGPFLVIATQNPIDFHGTYPLPEAQLDRFLVQLHLGYPAEDHEVAVLYSQQEQHPLEEIGPVLSREDVLHLQAAVRQVHVERNVGEYLVRIVRASRDDPRLKLGVSPRGSLMLFRAVQAAAFAAGRDFALPDDVQRLAPHVLPHRMILTAKSRYGSVARGEIIQEILERVPVPT